MWPALPPGTLIRIGPRPAAGQPLFGRVALFELAGRLVVHRIVWVGRRCLVTKGDAASVFDPPIGRHAIVGLAEPAGAFPRLAGLLALALHPVAVAAGLADEAWHLLRGALLRRACAGDAARSSQA